jgi:hypothetical protein
VVIWLELIVVHQDIILGDQFAKKRTLFGVGNELIVEGMLFHLDFLSTYNPF